MSSSSYLGSLDARTTKSARAAKLGKIGQPSAMSEEKTNCYLTENDSEVYQGVDAHTNAGKSLIGRLQVIVIYL